MRCDARDATCAVRCARFARACGVAGAGGARGGRFRGLAYGEFAQFRLAACVALRGAARVEVVRVSRRPGRSVQL